MKKDSFRRRISILTNAVPGYRVPVFEPLAKDDGLDVNIFVSLPAEVSSPAARQALTLRHSRGINLRRRTLHNQTATENVEWLHIPLLLFFDLLLFRPDVVITGEFGLRSLVAFLVSRLRRVPLVIWSEEIAEHAAGVSGLQRRLRSFLIPRADAFLAWGKPAEQYLKSWGVPDERIYYCAQAVDNEFWRRQTEQYDKAALRNEFGFSGRVFLAVGRLMERKGFDKLIMAWAMMSAQARAGNTLVIVGGGAQESALRDLVESTGLTGIVLTGAQGPEQLARYYAAADVFVFPSLLDVWGLVVNEAMAAGLPVLASKYAGASQELVRDSGAGELFDPNDLDEFSALLQRWCTETAALDAEHLRALAGRLNFAVSTAAIRRMIMEQCGGLANEAVLP